MKRKDNILIILAFIFLTTVVFRSCFFQGQVPFPANLLVSFYSPWRHYEWEGYHRGPPNKPMGFDDLRLFYPYRKLTIDQLKIGQWPLWNPYNFSGNIHLATYQTAVFYPLNVFYFLLPQIDAWSLLVFLQPILAGFFMYLFLKELSLSKRASFFGALAFAFSGWMLVWLEEDLVKEHSVLWLPLILYAVERLNKYFSVRSVILLVFSVATAILAGFLQLSLYVFATIFFWTIFRYWRLKKEDYRRLMLVGLCFLLGFLISSAHLLPAIEAYFLSPRGVTDAKFLFDEYLMPFWHLVTLLAPDFWGNPGAYNYFGSGFYHEKMIYVGIPVLLFSLFALFSRQKNRELSFFKWFSLVTLALGFFPLGLLLYYSRLPLLSTMIPSRIFILPTFGLGVLAAFGLDRYLKSEPDWKLWRNLFAVIGSVFIILWFFILRQKVFSPQGNYATISFRNLILPTGFFLASTAVILLPWLKSKIKPLSRLDFQKIKTLSFLGLVFLTLLSSFYFANKYLYFSERRYVFPEVAVIVKLKEISGINRVWGYGNASMEENVNAYHGLYSSGGYDALFSQRYGELLYTQETQGKIMDQIGRCDATIKQASEREGVLDNWYRKKLLSLLGVKYIIETKVGEEKELSTEEKRFPEEFFRLTWQDEKLKIWEYKEALPRAFLVYDYLVETDKQKIADYLFDENFDLGKKIVLEKEPGLAVDKKEGVAGKVAITQYAPNRIELETQSSTPALLFLSDNYYPGWKASVDGKEVAILRANFSFRSVALPEGKHKVIFSYEPKVFFWGLRISVLSLILLAAWLVFVDTRGRVQEKA